MSANNQNKNTAKYNNKNQNKVPTKVPTKVQEVSTWNNSIFIPAIPFAVTKNQLKDAMESNLGTVHRIDFATFNSDNGSGRRAFVHFDHTYQTDFTKVLRQEIAQKGHFDVYYPMYKMNLRIMMNKNPVPETDKTIHQVASDIDFMGEKIRLHEETFVLMQERMNKLDAKNQELEEENKAMKQYMENMFHRVESLWGDVQRLHLDVPMPMSMPMSMSMPGFYPMMPMPMPMPNYYYPIHQIPMDPNLVEEESLLEEGEELEEREEPVEREEQEYPYDSYDDNDKSVKKGKMVLSELM